MQNETDALDPDDATPRGTFAILAIYALAWIVGWLTIWFVLLIGRGTPG